MRKRKNLGDEAVKEIHQLWQIDADQCEWVQDSGGKGFDWWPGNFKVEVRSSGPDPETRDTSLYRLSVRTAYLRGVDTSEPGFFDRLSIVNGFMSTCAVCCPPDSDGHLFLQSTAYVHSGTAGWLPRFLAGEAILQPIEAELRAERAAELLGGEPDRTADETRPIDEMLESEELMYRPVGKGQSRWAGTGEFEAIAEKWGRSDAAFGTADAGGLTLEKSFGNDSAMLQLFTDQPHPVLGNGLLALLRFPFSMEPEEAQREANQLNCMEASFSLHAPLVGSWSARDGEVTHSSFLPNVVYHPGLAENVVMWSMSRAQWVREEFFPDAEDLPMHEILAQRLG